MSKGVAIVTDAQMETLTGELKVATVKLENVTLRIADLDNFTAQLTATNAALEDANITLLAAIAGHIDTIYGAGATANDIRIDSSNRAGTVVYLANKDAIAFNIVTIAGYQVARADAIAKQALHIADIAEYETQLTLRIGVILTMS